MALWGDGLMVWIEGVDWIDMGVVGGASSKSSCSTLVVDDWLLSGVTGTAMAEEELSLTLDFLDGVFVAGDRDDWRLGLGLGTSSGGNDSGGTEVDVDASAWAACCRVRRCLLSNQSPPPWETDMVLEALRVVGMLKMVRLPMAMPLLTESRPLSWLAHKTDEDG